MGEKIKKSLNPNYNGSLTNGYAATNEHELNGLEEAKEENVVTANNEEETLALNDPMTEVLNNETSVDDIETNEDVNKGIEQQPLFNNTVTTTNSNTTDTLNNDEANNEIVAVNVNDEVTSNNVRHNHAINECAEPVEQVVQMQNLQINEENLQQTQKDPEDVIAATSTAVEQKQQQQQPPLPTITVTVNPVVVTQTLTTNAEVPLVV